MVRLLRFVRVVLLPAAAAAVILPAVASAQVRMIQVDEVLQEVTIRNFGGTAVDVSSYQMCREPGTYRALSALTLVSGDLMLDPDEEVTFVYTFILSAGTGIGLYLNGNNFNSAANMADYMQYKGVSGFREGVAVTAQLWTAGEFAAGDDGPWFYDGDGVTENGAAFWSNVPEPSPTLLGAAALGVVAWRRRAVA